MVLNSAKRLVKYFDLCTKFSYNKMKISAKVFVLAFSVFLFPVHNVLGFKNVYRPFTAPSYSLLK